ncbi:MAG: hypothetical protein OEM97_11165 [Acidimicrobiia bacterium]|nr:hypothetical protein [Acidimicrobiia bacterium]
MPLDDPLTAGQTAPEFELRWTFATSVRLHKVLERGPALIAFYVFDFGQY